MKLNELKSIVLKTASSSMKKEGEDAFKKGLVTNFKGKKIDSIYHIYGRVKDKNKAREYNAHIKINLQKKKFDGAICTCDEFKESASNGYTLMCSHIAACAYKFFSLLSKDNNEESKITEKNASEKYNIWGNTDTTKLVKKSEKDLLYYEVFTASKVEKLILKPSELRTFLKGIKSKKIRFKYDYMEFTVPIIHKDMPLTFNLKEHDEYMVLTTHKQIPIPLTSDNDVYYFKNELYLPSKKQIKNFIHILDKIKSHGKIIYKKNIDNYNNLISILSNIAENINIAESLKDFVSNTSKPEILVSEDNGDIYCDVFFNYGKKKINILNESKNEAIFIRDYKKEEKFLMEMEKHSFTKIGSRFFFTGGDEELFYILRGSENSIHSLGKVIIGKGLNNRRIYDSEAIKGNLNDIAGCYEFSYSIGDMKIEELNSAFEAYTLKNKFYKTKSNNFLDFEDDNVISFFNLIEVLNLNIELKNGKTKVEKSKALYLFKNINTSGIRFIKSSDGLKELEDKLVSVNNTVIKPPKNFKGILREYQVNGYMWFKTLSELGFGGILADEMGLGKTIQAIAFLLSEVNKKTLIVCPTSLIYNWKEEMEKFAPDLKVLVIHGIERADIVSSISQYDVILTTYGTLRMDIDNYNNIIFDYCIIDEGQNIKNVTAQNTKVIKGIKANSRFALTGTPIENNLKELWSIFDFVMPGYLYSKEKFEEKFILRGEENLESLKELIKPFILRRTKKEVIEELPDKIEKKLLVEMTSSQKVVYKTYIKRIKSMMKNKENGKIEILSYLTKLREICLEPSLILEDYNGGSGKMEVAVKLIKEHIDYEGEHGKVLLFSQFASALNMIGERLSKENIKFFHLDGKTKPKDRIKMVKHFNSSEDTKVFLISLKAGGTGLNLTSANLVIHFDPWWNPAVEAQATDRAHRIGQKKSVQVIKLIAKGTIEEKIIMLQEDKRELIDNILTVGLQNSSLLRSLSKDELFQLFERE